MKNYYLILCLLCLGLSLKAQIINFPDAIFKGKLLEADITNTIAKDLTGNYCKIDSNNDGEIQHIEASVISYLAVQNSNISYLTGIEYFVNLTTLICAYNQLTSINLTNNVALTYLNCHANEIPYLNLSNNTALVNLACSYNPLGTLDISNNHALSLIYCCWNQLTSLDVSNNPALTILECFNNQITSLDVSNNVALTKLWCLSNQLTSLDLSYNTQLVDLRCDYNQLVNLNINNTRNESFLIFSNNPTLQFVCCDASQLTQVQNLVAGYSYTDCVVSSNCALSNEVFDFKYGIKFYPNPTHGILNIQNKSDIQISSVNIYNTLGQLVLVLPEVNDTTVDVSDLLTGTYFIKINSYKGTANAKFIKD